MEACEASPGLPEALLHVAAALEAVGTCSNLPQVNTKTVLGFQACSSGGGVGALAAVRSWSTLPKVTLQQW